MMSAFRIIPGVAAAACAILLLGFLGGLLARVAPRFSLFLLGCIICGLGIRSIYVCLRYGWAGGGKVTAYTRYGSPFHFWCNVLFRYFVALVGLALCVAAFFIPR
jgi:hypothetical protein